MDKKRSYSWKSQPLGVWLAVGMGVFVLLGSLAVVTFFQQLSRVEEAAALESLGRTNALFLDQSGLPQSRQMERQLGRVMGARVEFRERDEAGAIQGVAQHADGRVRRDGGRLEVGFELKSGRQVWFSRDARQAGMNPVWRRADAMTALAGWWVLALGFSWWLGHQVTRPLASLAAALPEVGGERVPTGLPDSGPREIRDLANALTQAHESLVAEREKRRHAERLALLGRMAASLAHEVRNPVSAIRLHAQLLERELADGARDAAGLIVTEAGRIESLVAQWLRYAKPQPVSPVSLNVVELVGEAMRVLDPQARHAGVEIREEIDPAWDRQPVCGDRERLLQVLCNLLLNSIQSMPRGGVVKARVLTGALEIEDGGGGFSQAALDRFGEPFYSEREGGMGLGLAVSKEIIESHGGRLEAANLPGGGARVRVIWGNLSI